MDLYAQLQLLGDTQRQVSMAALRPLSGLSASHHALFWPLWSTIDRERRLTLITAMVNLAEDNVELDFRSICFWALDDTDSAVRVAAIQGLWEDDSLTTMRRLLTLLINDSAVEVRAAAAVCLTHFAYLASVDELGATDAQRLLDVLLQVLHEPDQATEVRRRALEAAGYYASSDAVQHIVEQAYGTGDQLMCESALAAMGRSMLPRWLPLIAKAMESQSPALRYEAARAAGEYADVAIDLTPRLITLAGESDSEVALAAIWALGQIGGESARRALRQLARSQDTARREAATEALEELSLGDSFLGGDWRQN